MTEGAVGHPQRGLARWVMSAIVMLALSTPGLAHRGHGTWTDMVWTDTGFEITHRMHLADAMAVLTRLDPDTPIDSDRGLALFALYTERNFRILQNQTVVRPKTLGAEIVDDFVLVYQELEIPLPTTMPTVTASMLRDIEPEAQNYLRYETPEENRTHNIGVESISQ